ncbi:MAG TPA: undecaprenyl-diphosphate phosphatase [Firmicutes bacterium]|nr:undecaprenyl-diphosphate phosphatase [Bacillota bacterium]
MSNAIVAIFLGIVQGITEFLPVSSSGHLVLTQRLLGVSFPGVTFEVAVHFGSLLAIGFVFWSDIVILLRTFLTGLGELFRGRRPSFRGGQQEAWRLAWLIIFGSIPTAFMGLFLEPIFEELFQSVTTVGFMLLVTGTLLWLIERNRGTGGKGISEMGPSDAFFIGLAQGCAIMPGLSRSGTTIAGALFRGLNRETAMRYSFLLALPTIAGATLFKLGDIVAATSGTGLSLLDYALGLMAAAVTGVLALKVLYRLLRQGRLYIFGYYCWLVGLITLGLHYLIR